MNISHQLAEFAAHLTYGDIPGHIKENINIRILDFVSSAAAGWRVNGEMNNMIWNVIQQQPSEPQSSLLFRKEMLSASQAAFYNAFLVNGADMDDGHMLANGHPCVTVIAPVLALAEWKSLPYERMAEAITAGYDIYIRLSKAIMPSHLQRGFNGTGTAGSIAAAAAAAKALGLDTRGIHVAIGLASACAAGIMELNKSGQAMKPLIPASAAYHGVMCALMAEAGAVGPDAPLDGDNGFFHAFADVINTEAITDGLGKEFQLDTAYIKLYPACRHMHAMIDCAAMIRSQEGFCVDEVDKLILYTYPMSEKLTGGIKHPKSGSEAKFSLTYATAVGLMTGSYSLSDLTSETEKGQQVSQLIDRMEIVVDPELENRSIMKRGARLEAVLKNGKTFQAEVDMPKGEKSNPASLEDYKRKLFTCAEGLLTEKQCEEAFAAGCGFGKDTVIRVFFATLISER